MVSRRKGCQEGFQAHRMLDLVCNQAVHFSMDEAKQAPLLPPEFGYPVKCNYAGGTC